MKVDLKSEEDSLGVLRLFKLNVEYVITSMNEIISAVEDILQQDIVKNLTAHIGERKIKS